MKRKRVNWIWLLPMAGFAWLVYKVGQVL